MRSRGTSSDVALGDVTLIVFCHEPLAYDVDRFSDVALLAIHLDNTSRE